jgi:hypothetical protein
MIYIYIYIYIYMCVCVCVCVNLFSERPSYIQGKTKILGRNRPLMFTDWSDKLHETETKIHAYHN